MTTAGGHSHPLGKPSSAIPGPANRESFFEAQKRNRRATWRLSAACVLAVLFTGIPLSLILAPPLYGLLLLGLAVAKRYGTVPPEVWQTLVQIGSSVGAVVDHFSSNKPLPPMDTLKFRFRGHRICDYAVAGAADSVKMRQAGAAAQVPGDQRSEACRTGL